MEAYYLWYSSCIYGRLFQPERGGGYESGVTAFSIPEGCPGTEAWVSSNEKEISILPGPQQHSGGAAFFVQREVRRRSGQPQPSGPGRELSEVTSL